MSRVSDRLDAVRVDAVIAEVRQELLNHPRIELIVFELDSPGGDLKAAEKLASFIAKDLKSHTTVAFIPPEKVALGEGVLIALACGSIVMGKDSRLGAASRLKEPSPAEEAALKEALRKLAGARGYPQILFDAMATKNHETIYSLRFATGPNGNEEKSEFLTPQDIAELSRERKALKRGEPVVEKEKGQLLVLSGQDAKEKYRIAKVMASDLKELQVALGVLIGDQNIIVAGHGALVSENPSVQALIDFLNQPVPRFLLLLCGCLALLVELKAFGTFIPGTIALACFTVFFAASSFPVTGRGEGTASLWEIILFVIGVALIGVEFLLLPGIAIFAIAGAAISAVSLVLAMVPADASQLSGGTMTDAIEEAVGILAFGFGAGSLCFLLLLRYLPKHSVFARRGLVSSAVITGVPTADSALAAQAATAGLVGAAGMATTTLRPAGKMELDDGRMLDVVAEGEFIEKGTRLKVIQCDAGIAVVSRCGKTPE